MRKILHTAAALVLSLAVCAGMAPALHTVAADATAGVPFTDVPADSWALGAIQSAVTDGLMHGTGNGLFGYGKTITRAEFVTVLNNMFAWSAANPAAPDFKDVAPSDWYYGAVEAAVANGAAAGGGNFYPNAPILRRDMAVMLVRALGYDSLAGQVAQTQPAPFSDVAGDPEQGYMTVAYDIGMISGVGGGLFAPDNTAKREEAAAMLTRVYDKLNAPAGWLQGFYAFSSYSQQNLITDMNAVTFGWSAMRYDPAGGAALNTSPGGGNPWCIPASYELVADYPRQNGVDASLGVFMDTTMGLYGLLADSNAQTDAINQIVTEATRVYDAVGGSPYDGVTIDFEGLKGADTAAEFTQFLTGLHAALQACGRSLYVTVQPISADGQSFDGYDYRGIGQIADKVILMAYNYQPASMAGFIGTPWEKYTAPAPIAGIYAALRAVTDPASGVGDRGKIALALNFACTGWMVDGDDDLTSPDPVTPPNDTVLTRMNQPDTILGWSQTFMEPYMIYTTGDGGRVFLWYEDSRSVAAKLELARLFGVSGVSVWRLGIVPNYPGWDAWTGLAK